MHACIYSSRTIADAKTRGRTYMLLACVTHAGVKVNDVIQQINGVNMMSMVDFEKAFKGCYPGDKIALLVVRCPGRCSLDRVYTCM